MTDIVKGKFESIDSYYTEDMNELVNNLLSQVCILRIRCLTSCHCWVFYVDVIVIIINIIITIIIVVVVVVAAAAAAIVSLLLILALLLMLILLPFRICLITIAVMLHVAAVLFCSFSFFSGCDCLHVY